jgi:membrane protease YdiL (CAAX protease family)
MKAIAAVIGYAAAYTLSAWWLHRQGALPVEEAAMLLLVVGAGFSFLSWLTTIGLRPEVPAIARPAAETLAMLGLVAALAAWLVWGKGWADSLFPDAAQGGPEFGRLLGELSVKLIVFVAVPFLVFRALFGHGLADFGLGRAAWRRLWGREGAAALGIGVVLCTFQYFVGSGASPIRNGEIAGAALWIGLPLSFLWLVLLVGLVEEFFFRSIVQTRLAALFRSEIAGLCVMALIFGLVHAPGMVLRGAGEIEGLGASPDWATAAAYVIVVQSVAAFYVGIFWLRTRNLPAVMIIHAATDLLPSLREFVGPFGLAP